MKRLHTLILLPAVLISSSAVAGERVKPRVAVIGIVGSGVSNDLLEAVEDLVSLEASEVAEMDVISSSDLKAVLTLAQYKQVLGCVDEDCMAELGHTLSVEQMISGSVRKMGDGYTVALQRFDVVNNRVLARATQSCNLEPAQLMRAVRRAVPSLFGVVGRVVLWDQPSGAEVFFDDRLVGRTPVGPLTVKTAGSHRIGVLGPGLTPWHVDFEIEAGADLRIRTQNKAVVDLEARAGARRTVGLTLLGVAAAAAVGAGGFWWAANRNDHQIDRLDLRTTSQVELDAITGRSFNFVLTSAALGVIAGALGLSSGWALIHNPAQDTLDAHGFSN